MVLQEKHAVDLHVSGKLIVESNIAVIDNLDIGLNCDVHGNCKIGTGIILSKGDLSINDGNIVQVSNISSRGELTAKTGKFSSAITIGNHTLEKSNVFFASKVKISESLNVAGNVLLTGSKITINGETEITQNLKVSNDICISGNQSIIGALDVTGDTRITGKCGITGEIIVDGISKFNSNTNFNGITTFLDQVNCSKSVVVGEVLISSNSILAPLVTFANATIEMLSVGSQNISKSLSVSTLSVTSTEEKAIDITGGLSIGGNIIAAENVTIKGLCHIYGPTTINNSLVVVGGLTISKTTNIENVEVRGLSNFYKNIHSYARIISTSNEESNSVSSGSIVTSGGIGVQKNFTLGGKCFIGGDAIFNGNTVFNGSQVTFSGTMESTSSNTGSVVISGGLGVQGSFNCNKDFSILGQGIFHDMVTVNNNLFVSGGDVNISGNFTSSGNLNVLGSSHIKGSCSVEKLKIGSSTLQEKSDTLFVLSSFPDIRFATVDANKTRVYDNSISLFSLGNTYSDGNHESLQISTDDQSYTIRSRSFGRGLDRNISLMSGKNGGNINLSPDGTVSINNFVLSNKKINFSGAEFYIDSVHIGNAFVKNLNDNLNFNAIKTLSFTVNEKALLSLDDDGLTIFGNIKSDSLSTGIFNIFPKSSDSECTLTFQTKKTTPLFAGDEWFIGRNVTGFGSQSFVIGYNDPNEVETNQSSIVITNSGNVHFTSKTNALNNDTGSVIIYGGIGISKDVYIGGNIHLVGNVLTTDQKLQENIKKYDTTNLFDKITKLESINYTTQTSSGTSSKTQIGFIVQDLEEVFPEHVTTDAHTGDKSIDYIKFNCVLLEAVKMLHTEIENLKTDFADFIDKKPS